MEISNYFSKIKEVIDLYSTTRFVIDTIVSFDIRPGEQGYLKGIIHFADNSALHFKKFVDSFDDTVEKLMYVYHYQYPENQLIFRYDNALHKPKLPFLQHKHLPEQMIEAAAPTLAGVLEEVFADRRWAE